MRPESVSMKNSALSTSQLVRSKSEKSNGDYDLEDRITALPDDVLSKIVHQLSIKEAAATSVLSKRWKPIWKSRTILDFSDARFVVAKGHPSVPELYQDSQRYVKSVNRTIKQHSNPVIKRFRVCFVVHSQFTKDIVNWIQFAMNKKVEILELEFYTDSRFTNTDLISPFPKNLSSLFGFQFLKVLHVRCVDVSGEVLEYFLSNCEALEQLTVNASRSLVHLRVVGPSIALKHLTLINCSHLESVEVRDAKLVSFHLFGVEVKDLELVLTNVPLLVDVSYMTMRFDLFRQQPKVRSIERLVTPLSSCISQLEILSLDISRGDYNPSHVIPILTNLRHLELKFGSECGNDLRNVKRFIEASPYLHKLVLKLHKCTRTRPGDKCRKIGGGIANFPRDYLKVLEIVGYRGSDCHVQLALYFVTEAAGLEKLVIDPVRRWGDWPDKDLGEEKEVGRAVHHAKHHIKRKLPSTVEFVCKCLGDLEDRETLRHHAYAQPRRIGHFSTFFDEPQRHEACAQM